MVLIKVSGHFLHKEDQTLAGTAVEVLTNIMPQGIWDRNGLLERLLGVDIKVEQRYPLGHETVSARREFGQVVQSVEHLIVRIGDHCIQRSWVVVGCGSVRGPHARTDVVFLNKAHYVNTCDSTRSCSDLL